MRWSVSGLWTVAIIALGAAPCRVSGQVEVTSDLRQEQAARAGERYENAIVLHNPTARAQDVTLRQTDYSFAADGSIDFGDAGRLPRSNARWISLFRTTVRIAPGQSVRIPYTVEVPPVPSRGDGTYWSVVMVEGVPQDAKPARAPAGAARPSLGIRTVVRHGIQLVTHVGGGTVDAAFPAARIVRRAGEPATFELDIANTGARSYRLALKVEIFDAAGHQLRDITATSDYLYPGTSNRQRVLLGELPSGVYKALVVADAGADQIFGAQYELRF